MMLQAFEKKKNSNEGSFSVVHKKLMW